MHLLKNKVARNASWIIGGKIVQAFLGLIVSMLTARYLGPSNYGLINYASSIVGFVIPLVFLGLNNTLVQELTINPEKEGEIIGTSILLSLVSAVLCILGIFIFVSIANAGEKDTIIVCMLYSILLIFQVLDLIQYWFQSKLLSKYSSMVTLVAYILISVYKIVLLMTQRSVYWFAIASTLDYLLISLGLLFIYHRLGGNNLSFSIQTGKALFKKSKHYIVTGLMVAIFAQTDKIMLKLMLGEDATGYYSAAVACASMTSFVYTAIIDSFRPVIFKSHEVSNDKFELNLKRLYAIIIYLSLAQSIVMTVFAKLIIGILYGQAYAPAINALRIVTWYITFAYMGSVRNIWILSKNLQNYLWIINMSGAVLNVVINYALIPVFGVNGAAIASFVTQFFTNFLMGYIIPPIRENNKLIIEAFRIKYLRSLFGRS